MPDFLFTILGKNNPSYQANNSTSISLLFEAFRDTARYLDLTDWSGDSYSPAEEMDYASQRFAVIDLPDDAKPQTQTFDGRKYLTDEAFYNSLISGGVEWEPLKNE